MSATPTRREFLAASTAAAALGTLPAQGGEPAKLAIHGGAKSVGPAPKLVRWGEPEREQLGKVVDQSSLLY